jgi:TadE-like protein
MKRKEMRKGNSSQNGQALIEFALIMPLLFLLVVNVVNFGGLFSAWITVTHATRSAAQFAITGPAYLGYGAANGLKQAPPSNADVLTILGGTLNKTTGQIVWTCPHGDLCSLPNRPSITVKVCTTPGLGSVWQNGGMTPLPPPCSTLADPEPATSVVTTVDVSYRYCPLIPFWDFPALGIHSTLRSCSSNNGDTSVCPATGNISGICVHRTAAMRMIQ